MLAGPTPSCTECRQRHTNNRLRDFKGSLQTARSLSVGGLVANHREPGLDERKDHVLHGHLKRATAGAPGRLEVLSVVQVIAQPLPPLDGLVDVPRPDVSHLPGPGGNVPKPGRLLMLDTLNKARVEATTTTNTAKSTRLSLMLIPQGWPPPRLGTSSGEAYKARDWGSPRRPDTRPYATCWSLNCSSNSSGVKYPREL